MNIVSKFTTILCIFIVNSVCAQITPSTTTERLNGLEKRKLLETGSLLKDIKFRNIGPSLMSGRMVDMDVNPADPTEFYIAYATGGLWHTVNNGQSFTSLFDKEYSNGIGDIAVNWSTRTIWVGTGEANSSRSSYAGFGVYKSTDEGKTWQWMGLPESQHIGKIVLHPTDNNIAWVAVLGHLYSPNKERGVYKTTDGGRTWKQTLYVDDNTGAVDMDINPSNPDELYTAMWYRTRRAWNFEEGGKTSGIYKSTDGGNTWKLSTKMGSGFPTGDSIGRIGIAVYAANPKIVYATLDNQGHRPDTTKKTDSNYVLKDFKNITKEGIMMLDNKKLDTFLIDNNFPAKYRSASVKELIKQDKIKPGAIYDYLFDANTALFETPIIGCEIYRSDDAGMSWKKVNTRGLSLYNTYGYYFGKISVSPTNENKLVISGFNLMMSDDGGKTFKSTDKPSTHPDWHGAWIDPHKEGHWIAGNDGGCNITYDNGQHWFKANTPAVGQFYNIAVDNAKPYNVYGGLQDNGSWFGPSTGSESDQWNYESPNAWKNIGGGDGMQVQVDTRDNKIAYSGSQFGFYARRNTDGGSRPVGIHPQPDLGQEQYRYNWQSPIWLSRHNQDILYFGTNKFHRSFSKGDSMVALSGDLTTGRHEGDIPFGTLTTIVESPIRFGLIYVGTDDGLIHVSKDDGYTWTKISTALPKMAQGLYVSRILPSAYKEGRVYATLNAYRSDNFNPYLFVSEDFGATWSQLGMGLPAMPLNAVKEDPKMEDILYVGSDEGIYASFDRGKTFMTLGSNLPHVPVHDIAIQQRENEIVLGTHGRSIYIAKLDSVQKIFSFSQNKQPASMKSKAAIINNDTKKEVPAGPAENTEPAEKEKD